jgi:serine/threonine protein kinase
VPASAPSPALSLPSVLAGRYQVTRRLGQGSIAQVVAALDLATGVEVALKVLYPNLRSNDAIADRFRREVQVVRRIRHLNVVRIDDLIEADELLFLVMELHPGGDLADRLAANGPLSVPLLRVLGAQLCGALEAAHRAGVVHRDVKPQNILVGGDGDGLDTRLCDFGLARTADLAGLTTRSTVLGTAEYMAPEVITDGHADPRSDLYSLGVVLYEAATGRLPFGGDSPYQILRQHVTVTPPRPRELVPSLPAELDEAITRALAKEPLDRFSSAADLAAAMAGTALAVATRPATARATCRRCGGVVVELVRTCVDCGESSLRVRTEKGGCAVLVRGPGEPADKIDGRTHVALVKLLEEFPPGTSGLEELRKKPPRLPFYVAGQLDADSARALVARLEEVGLSATVEKTVSLWPWDVRAKAWRMGKRYLAVSGGVGWYMWFNVARLIQSPALAFVGVGLAVTVPLAAPVFLARRPLVRLKESAGAGDPAQERLAATLGALGRRADRRLVARVLDRLPLLERLGAADVGAPLAARAALAAEGLVSLDQAGAHLDERELQRAVASGQADGAAAAALDRLREAERLRAVLVADLLRSFSRLDLLCLKLARVEGMKAQARVAALASELEEVRLQLAAEDDLAGLLGSHS